MEYVVDNPDLWCPVCRTPFIDPVVTLCGHTFCSECIRGILVSSPFCPLDRHPLNMENLSKNYIISNLVDKLLIKCPHGCDETIARCDIELHSNDCSKLHKCCKCDLVFIPDGNSQVCEGCCVEEVTVNCHMVDIGCKWSGSTESRRNHENNCWFSQGKEFILEVNSKLSKLQEENKNLTQTIQNLITTSEHQNRRTQVLGNFIDKLLMDIRFLQREIITIRDHEKSSKSNL